MEDDNIFDENDALDYILLEEHSAEPQKTNKSSGCFSVVIAVSIPFAGILWWAGSHIT